MKKALLILLALFVIVGCDKKKDKKEENKDINIYEIIDKEFKKNNISFIRESELNHENYYASSAWQYVIDDALCIVDVYYFGEDSNIYIDALEKQAIRSKDYDNQYLSAVVNKGMAAIIWDGCEKSALIKKILMDL